MVSTALDHGFETQGGFIKAFQKVYGMTPGSYRMQILGRLPNNIQLISIGKRKEDEKMHVSKIENEINLREDRAIVLSSPGWHIGVVGIVASRILEKYRRPVFLICEEDNMGRGSGRSIIGFNLFEALCECSDILDKFGGHEMAAGITLNVKNIAEFRKRLNEIAKKINPEYFMDKLTIDLVVDEKSAIEHKYPVTFLCKQ
jgi:single-stranded DNA-specific DHH superfamily exonuclease